jgi:tetratricopeptide (TPR) repeat protein
LQSTIEAARLRPDSPPGAVLEPMMPAPALLLRRPRRAARLAGLVAAGLLLAAGAFAQDAGTEPPPAPKPDVFQDASQRYANCMATARSDPAAAEQVALAWFNEGGAAAAQHCQAVALIGLGRYQEAGELLERLARELPETETATIADLFGQAAQAWLLQGNYDRAVAVLDQAMSLAPYDVELVIDRAVAKASASKYWEAIDDLNVAAGMAPGRTDILVLRATAYRFVEAPELALEDIGRVLETEPQNPDAIFERGMLHALAGDIAAARADWQQVVQIAPGSMAAEVAQANLDATAAQ